MDGAEVRLLKTKIVEIFKEDMHGPGLRPLVIGMDVTSPSPHVGSTLP
jgi:hypothetical protein